MINRCGNCPKNGNVIFTSYPPQIRCEVTGKLHITNETCDVDLVEVVRCWDCKYNNHCLTQEFVEEESRIPFDKKTWFCADGDRKDGANDAAD